MKQKKLPSEGLRKRISNVVHRAICEETLGDGQGLCHLYCRVGKVVTTALTGHKYAFQIGEAMVRRNEDYPNYRFLSINPSEKNGQFHAWFVRVPENMDSDTHFRIDNIDDLEMVDLSFRHFPGLAKSVGLEWQRSNWPLFFWGTQRELTRLGVGFKCDATLLENFKFRDFELIEKIIARAKLITEGKSPPLPEVFFQLDPNDGKFILRLKGQQSRKVTLNELESTGLLSAEELEECRNFAKNWK